MRFTVFATALASVAAVSATLDPATSNTKGKVPSTAGCSASKTSKSIQAAECAYNTRVSGKQTFAVWTRTQTNSNGISYGTCSAYTCAAPTKLVANKDGWTFFWGKGGESSGVGTDCIKDPNTTQCGCENSTGEFIAGSNSCK